MKSLIILLFVVIVLCRLSQAGHIYTWDADINFQNEKNANTITFFFALESGLAKSQYVRTRFPDTAVKVVTAQLSAVGTVPSIDSTSVASSSSGDVYIQSKLELTANTWYQLTLTFDPLWVPNQTSGYKGVVYMDTSSDIVATRIIYDSNSVAAVYQLAPKPSETMGLTINYPSGSLAAQRTALASSYDVFFDIKPQVEIKGGTLLRIEMAAESYFRFGGSCQGADQSCADGVANCENITLVLGNCVVSSDNKRLVLTATSDIVKDKTIRIKTTVTNPSIKRDSGSIVAYSISKLANLIFEKITKSSVFSVDGITPGKPTVKYLWGVSTFNSKTICPLAFYRKATSSETIDGGSSDVDVFNDLSLEFSIPSTPSGQNLRVEISTPSSTDFDLITGSMRTDLPAFTGKTLKIEYAGASSGGVIAITNVNPLSSASTYRFYAKIKFQATQGLGSQTSFAITLKAIAADGSFISLGSGTAADFKIVKNYEYLDIGSTNDGIHNYANYVVADNPIGFNSVFSKTDSYATTAHNAFLRKLVYLNSAATGYNGVAIGSEPVLELIFLMAANLNQLCCADSSKCELGSGNNVGNCATSGLTAGKWVPAISLNIVANTNILKLDTSASPDGTSGVYTGIFTYGTFWGGCGYSTDTSSTGLPLASTTCVSSGKKLDAASSIIKNGWDTSDTGIAYLQATCVPTAHQNPAGDYCLSIPVNAAANGAASWTAANTGALGIRKKDSDSSVFSSDKVSQLYPNQFILDFLICFGFSAISDTSSPHTRPTSLSSFALASQSLLNVFVINTGVNTANLRLRFFNYLAGESSNLYKSPQFLRVSGYLASGSYNAMNIFLDQSIGITNAKYCASSSTVSCVSYSSSRQQAGSPVLTNRIDVIGSIGSGSSAPVEYFIPITPSNSDPTLTYFIDVGLSASDDIYWSVKEIYRVNGYLWGSHQTSRLYATSLAKPGAFDYDSNVAANDDIGSSGCSGSGALIPLGTSSTYPGNTISDASTWTAVTTASCLGAPSSSNVQKGGTGFTVSHFSAFKHDLIGSATVKWTDTIGCIKFILGTDSNGFVCGLGLVGDSTSTTIPATNNILVRGWTVPWTWGVSYSLDKLATSFAWSKDGQIAAYRRQTGPDSTAYQRSCALSDFGTVYKKADLQKLSFTFAPSSGIDLSVNSFQLIVSFGNSPDGLSFTSTCSVTYSSGTGSCSASISGSTGTFAFTRNSPFSTSLAKGTQTVSLVVSQTESVWSSSVASTTVNAVIKYDSYQIDSCGTDKTISYSASDISATLGLASVVVQPTKASRSSFSFTFSVTSSQRQIMAGSRFEFNLAWLGDNLAGVAGNLHCLIKSGSSVSFGWSTLDFTSTTSPILTALNDNAPASYVFYCDGAKAPSLSLSDKMTFSWKSGSLTLASISSTDASALSPLALTDQANVLELSLSNKLWNSPGFEASYTFLFKPKKANYTLEARIYIDFAIDIPPRGNSAGMPSCDINSTKVYCQWAQERRLVVWPVSALTSLQVGQYSYELSVHGIAQPASFSSFKTISVTLDTDSDPFNGVSEWNELLDTVPSTSSIVPLLISAYENSNSITRANTEIKISLNIPKSSIVKDARLYADFPPYFADSLLLISSVSCTLVRISDLTNTNLVQNCTILRNRRVKVFTNADAASDVDNIYVLTLGGIPTPSQPTLNAPYWVRVFLASQDETSISSSTFPGYINASWPVFNHQANKQVPDWFTRSDSGVQRVSGNLEVAIGTYRGDVVLRAPTVAEVSYSATLGGDFVSSLAIYPSSLQVLFGVQDAAFRLGAKSNAIQGRYLVTASKVGDTGGKQIPIPPLPILVLNKTCQINANLDTIRVPAGGSSLPIVFDYTNCMPVNDVQLDANFSAVDKFNISFGPDVSTTTASDKLIFESWNKTRISFLVKSFNSSQKAGSKTVVSFSTSGTNKDSYKSPNPVTIELIDPAPFNNAPTVVTFTAGASAGQVALTLSCSSPGNLFYAIGTNGNVQSTTIDSIKNSTYASRISQTKRDPNDPWWTVLGYISQSTSTPVTAILTGVKSAALYYGVAYCQNQLDLTSTNNIKATWNQTDNGGRVAKATIVFNNSLSQDQQKDIACGLAALLKVPQNTVLTQDGIYCSSLRMLQAANSTNNSSTSSNVTVANNSSNYSYVWFVLPDFAAASSAVHTNLQALMVAGFSDNLFAQTTNKASTFPVVKSFSFSAASSAIAPIPTNAELNPVLNVFLNYITFDISMKSSSGFVYWGIGKNSSVKPVGRILRDGIDNLGSPLAAYGKKYAPNSTVVSFNTSAQPINNDTDYKLFLSLSSEDPSAEASFSDVIEIAFHTSKPSFSGKISVGSVILCLLFLLFNLF